LTVSNWDYGSGFGGLAKLAYVGIAAVYALMLIVPVGLAVLIWWAFHHVTIH
jgi:hypothetical protein